MTEKASEAQRRETGEGGRPVLWGPWSPLGTGFQGGGRISWLDPPGNSHRRGDLIRAGPGRRALLHFSLPAAVLRARVTPSAKASLEVVTQDGEACLAVRARVAPKEGPRGPGVAVPSRMHRGPSAPLALTVGTDRAGEGALWPRGLLQRSGWGWGAGTVREDGGHRLLQAPPHSGGWAAQPSRCFRHDLPATLSPRPGPRRPPRTSRSPRRPSEGPEGVGARHRHAAGRRRAGPPDPRGGAAGRGGEGEGSAGARAGPGPSRHLPPFPLRTVRLAQAVPRSADDTRAVPYAPTRPRQIPRGPSPRKRSRSSRAPTAYAAPRRARRAGAGPPLRPTTLCAWPRAPLPAEPGRTSRAPGAGGSALGRRCLRTCVFPRGRRGEGGAVPGRVSGPAGMSSLLAKDAYLQGLARKICSQPSLEPQKRTSGNAQPAVAVGPGRASGGGRYPGCGARTPPPAPAASCLGAPTRDGESRRGLLPGRQRLRARGGDPVERAAGGAAGNAVRPAGDAGACGAGSPGGRPASRWDGSGPRGWDVWVPPGREGARGQRRERTDSCFHAKSGRNP